MGVTSLVPAFLKPVTRAIASRWPWPVSVRVGGDALWVDLRSSIGRGVFATGAFDEAVYRAAAAPLSKGDVVIDVGANIGYYALRFARAVGPDGRVHAFEVDERALRCLRRTLRHNAVAQLHLHELAVASSPGVLYLSETRESGHTRAYAQGPGRAVPCVCLDDHLAACNVDRVDLIKIDVEGAELQVLQGAQVTLRNMRPRLVVEVVGDALAMFGDSPHELANLLDGLNYEMR
jgi:FkbM family methyltransferase